MVLSQGRVGSESRAGKQWWGVGADFVGPFCLGHAPHKVKQRMTKRKECVHVEACWLKASL